MPIYLPASGGEIKDYRQASKTKIPSLHIICWDRIKNKSCGATRLDANASDSPVPSYGGFVHGVPLRRT